jgi:hypothetical protein
VKDHLGGRGGGPSSLFRLSHVFARSRSLFDRAFNGEEKVERSNGHVHQQSTYLRLITIIIKDFGLRHSRTTYRLSSCPSSLLSNPSTSRDLETRGEFRSTVSIFRLRAPHWAINIPTKITTTNSQATCHSDPWIRTSSVQERCVHGVYEVDLSRSD